MLPEDFNRARCWLEELNPPKPYSKVDLPGRGVCKTCHVVLKDPAFQPPNTVDNNHRGVSLAVSHEPFCPGPCPGLHKCVLYKVYGRSFVSINNLQNSGVKHGAEIKQLVSYMKRKEREQRREKERQAKEERKTKQQEDRLVAQQRMGSIFRALSDRMPSVEGKQLINSEELKECLQVCRDIAATYRDTPPAGTVNGQVAHSYTI